MSTIQQTTEEKSTIKRDFYHLIINGEKVESSNGGTIKTYNPATGELIAEVARKKMQKKQFRQPVKHLIMESGKNPLSINVPVH